MFARFKHHILLHVIIFIWGFTGILGELISLDAIHIVWYRVIIAFLALLLAMPLLKTSFRITSSRRLLHIMGVGVLVCLHWVTFYQSIQLSTASLGILCLSTTTLHVSWLEPLVMKRPFVPLEFGLSLIVVGGLYFVSGDFNAKEYEALAYGLCSALLAAAFAVFNAKLAVETSPIQITLYEMLSAFVFLSVVMWISGDFTAEALRLTMSDFLWLLFLGIVCTSFAFLATIYIVRFLGAFTVSLSINLEPVYTIILAIFILHENEVLSGRFYVGSAVIISVVLANGVIKEWKLRRPGIPKATENL